LKLQTYKIVAQLKIRSEYPFQNAHFCFWGLRISVIEYLINFDRQTLRCGIAQTIGYFDCEAISAGGGWLAAENTRSPS
jgi:hypothetical protein